MGKKGGKQVQTNAVDAGTAAYNNDVHTAAKRAAGNYEVAGAADGTNQAAATYGQYAGAGANGLAALGGDPAAAARFMDPYQRSVIEGTNAQFAQDSAALDNNADSAATQAGAFGGSRAAVVKGAAQGQLALGHQQQVAGLLSSGFNGAMDRAGQVANLGLAGASGAQDVGAYLREVRQQQLNPEAERLRLLQAGQTAPNSTTQTTQMPGTNWLQTVGSVAGIGAGLFTGGLGGAALGAAGKLFGGGSKGGAVVEPDDYSDPFGERSRMR